MYEVNIEGNGGAGFSVRSEGYEFCISNENNGISPPSTMLASLGSCIAVYVKKYLKGANISDAAFEVGVRAEFCAEKPISFKKIYSVIRFKDDKVPDSRKGAIKRFVHNCPVHNTLVANPEIDIEIE